MTGWLAGCSMERRGRIRHTEKRKLVLAHNCPLCTIMSCFILCCFDRDCANTRLYQYLTSIWHIVILDAALSSATLAFHLLATLSVSVFVTAAHIFLTASTVAGSLLIKSAIRNETYFSTSALVFNSERNGYIKRGREIKTSHVYWYKRIDPHPFVREPSSRHLQAPVPWNNSSLDSRDRLAKPGLVSLCSYIRCRKLFCDFQNIGRISSLKFHIGPKRATRKVKDPFEPRLGGM